MTEEEKKQREDLLKEVEGKVKSVIDASQKEVVTKEQLDERLTEINKQIEEGLDDEQIKALKESVDKMSESQKELIDKQSEIIKAQEEHGTALNKLQEKGQKENVPRSFKEILRESILEKKDAVLKERDDDFGKRFSLKDYFVEQGHDKSPTFTLKAAVEMLQSNIVQSNVSTIRLTELDPNRVSIPLTVYPHVIDIMRRRTITRPTMSLLVVYDYQDGAGTKAEGVASVKSSFLLKTVEFKSFYIATHFLLSEETLDDLEEVLDEIGIIGPDKINQNIDSQVLGKAGDDSSALGGMLSAALTTSKFDAFVPGDFSGSVQDANIVDVALKAKLQMKNNGYMANSIYMSPNQVDSLAAAKNAFEDSRMDRRVVFNAEGVPVRVGGMAIIETEQIADNEMVVSDNMQNQLGIRRDLTMEIGRNGTDLVEGQFTAVVKARLAYGVRDAKANVYVSDINTAIATINSGA